MMLEDIVQTDITAQIILNAIRILQHILSAAEERACLKSLADGVRETKLRKMIETAIIYERVENGF